MFLLYLKTWAWYFTSSSSKAEDPSSIFNYTSGGLRSVGRLPGVVIYDAVCKLYLRVCFVTHCEIFVRTFFGTWYFGREYFCDWLTDLGLSNDPKIQMSWLCFDVYSTSLDRNRADVIFKHATLCFNDI